MVPCFRISILDNITAAAGPDGKFTSERRPGFCVPIGGDGSNSVVLGMPTLFTSENFNQDNFSGCGNWVNRVPVTFLPHARAESAVALFIQG
ncbi:C-14 sterol reductase [Aspergillus luchuensis]|uniref:C-14 sterol reductase n=1 Tax=Aspergillus kawachii TaxID=1069201 RepID=A0A146FZT6_ASPKA|nr:C-14 sterol reductase [Aspergillus luchuensis]